MTSTITELATSNLPESNEQPPGFLWPLYRDTVLYTYEQLSNSYTGKCFPISKEEECRNLSQEVLFHQGFFCITKTKSALTSDKIRTHTVIFPESNSVQALQKILQMRLNSGALCAYACKTITYSYWRSCIQYSLCPSLVDYWKHKNNPARTYWVVQAGLLTPLTFVRHHLAAFTSGAYFLHSGRWWQWLCEFYTANFKEIFEGL